MVRPEAGQHRAAGGIGLAVGQAVAEEQQGRVVAAQVIADAQRNTCKNKRLELEP